VGDKRRRCRRRQSACKARARRILDASVVGESPGHQTDTGRDRSPPIATSYEVGIDIRSNGRRLGFQWEPAGSDRARRVRDHRSKVAESDRTRGGGEALGSKDHRSKIVGNDTVASMSSPRSIKSKVAEIDTAAGISSLGSEIENQEFKEQGSRPGEGDSQGNRRNADGRKQWL
jgi:hypothetical protein